MLPQIEARGVECAFALALALVLVSGAVTLAAFMLTTVGLDVGALSVPEAVRLALDVAEATVDLDACKLPPRGTELMVFEKSSDEEAREFISKVFNRSCLKMFELRSGIASDL